MKATKEFLSLETNELLKDCGIESKYVYVVLNRTRKGIQCEEIKICERGKEWEFLKIKEIFPAFTWNEILWEYAELFFGIEKKYNDETEYFDNKFEVEKNTEEILNLLQQKKYDKADLYFRENTILIKK